MKMHYPSILATSFLLSFGLSYHSVRADEVLIDEKFDEPLSQSWNVRPQNTANVVDGQLTLTATGGEEGYAVSNVYYAEPIEKVNFTSNTVDITLTDLAIQGSADPVNQVFIFALTSDNISETEASSQLRLRIDGSGTVILRGQNNSGEAPFLDLSDHVALPIKKLKLILSPTGAALSITDASGTHQTTASFDTVPKVWSASVPFFRFQIQRNPGPGDAQITLESLTITSSPAQSAK